MPERPKIYNPKDPRDDGDLRKGAAERVWWAVRPSESKERQSDEMEQRTLKIPIVGDVD